MHQGPAQAGAPPSGPPWAGAQLSSKALLLSFVPQMLTKSCHAGKSCASSPACPATPLEAEKGCIQMTHKRGAGCGEGGCWEGAGQLHGALGWAGQLWGPGGVRSPQWVAHPERASRAPATLLLYAGVFLQRQMGRGNLDGGPEPLLGHLARPRVSRALPWWECRCPRRTGLVCRRRQWV